MESCNRPKSSSSIVHAFGSWSIQGASRKLVALFHHYLSGAKRFNCTDNISPLHGCARTGQFFMYQDLIQVGIGTVGLTIVQVLLVV